MLLIPAIDLKDGKCVRLRQGRMEDKTVFSDDPVSMDGKWLTAGAKRLHLVDLNGAFAGTPVNHQVIKQIAVKYPELILQVGGGIRDKNTVETYLDAGVTYCIIGTKAIQEPAFVNELCRAHPEHIIVGLDAKGGKVATDGWSNLSAYNVQEVALLFVQAGVSAIVYTDIIRDGMMTGVNIAATVDLAKAIDIPVIASGGITDLQDVKALCEVAYHGIMGAISGRALYEGTLNFEDAQKLILEYKTST